jgi:hypothetical protein
VLATHPNLALRLCIGRDIPPLSDCLACYKRAYIYWYQHSVIFHTQFTFKLQAFIRNENKHCKIWHCHSNVAVSFWFLSMWCCFNRQVIPDVLKECSTCIITIKKTLKIWAPEILESTCSPTKHHIQEDQNLENQYYLFQYGFSDNWLCRSDYLASNGGWFLNGNNMEMVMNYFKVLYQHQSGRTKETHLKNPPR